LEHYWIRNGKCTADKEYGISSVPHVVLLDKTGKIVFKGHPATRKLEEDLNDLLADKTLTGNGTSPAAGGDDEPRDPAEYNQDYGSACA